MLARDSVLKCAPMYVPMFISLDYSFEVDAEARCLKIFELTVSQILTQISSNAIVVMYWGHQVVLPNPAPYGN